MPIYANRGSAKFTIPDAVSRNISKVTPLEIKQMVDAILVMHNEFWGVAAILNDPVVPQGGGRINNSGSFREAVPNSLKARRLPGYDSASMNLYNSTKNFFTGGQLRLSINNINNFISSYNNLQAKKKITLDNNPTMSTLANSSKANVDTINTMRNNLVYFNSYLDGRNSWWNGDLCARTCQVNCQASCQVACQGCNNNTCHDQNCGGWS